jgi:thioredoxin
MEHLTLESFKDKVCDCGIGGSGEAEWKFKGTIPAVIDFYADWCGPCKMVGPILEDLSKEYDGRVNIYKINTEEQRELAGMFGISSIPSILFIPVEGQPQMAAGAMPKKEFKNLFREIFGVEEAVSELINK